MVEVSKDGLLSCPFCGADVYVQPARVAGEADWVAHEPITGGHRCGIQEFNNFNHDDDVVALWNTRATAALQAERDRYRVALEVIAENQWTDQFGARLEARAALSDTPTVQS